MTSFSNTPESSKFNLIDFKVRELQLQKSRRACVFFRAVFVTNISSCCECIIGRLIATGMQCMLEGERAKERKTNFDFTSELEDAG